MMNKTMAESVVIKSVIRSAWREGNAKGSDRILSTKNMSAFINIKFIVGMN